MTEKHPRARIGTSAWDHDHWQGHFYPPGLPKNKRLRYASERLATLELNSAFYGGGSRSSFLGWREATPDDFVFSVKGPQGITHDNALRHPAHGVADFFTKGILGLGEKLGAVLWQTSLRGTRSLSSPKTR